MAKLKVIIVIPSYKTPVNIFDTAVCTPDQAYKPYTKFNIELRKTNELQMTYGHNFYLSMGFSLVHPRVQPFS